MGSRFTSNFHRSVGVAALALLAVPCLLASSLSPLICSNPGSTVSTSNVVLNANSCLDYSNTFTQGANNWFYGYYSAPSLVPGGFTQMTSFNDPISGDTFWANDFTRYWTSLDAFGGHPNGVLTSTHPSPDCVIGLDCGDGSPEAPGVANEIEQWAVRRYVVPTGFTGGLVNIVLAAQKDPRTVISNPECLYNNKIQCPDGTMNEILLIHNGTVTNLGILNIPYAIANPTSVSAQVFVQAGDIVDFVMAPNGNDYGDGTFQLDTVQSVVPEPATLALVGGGLVGGWMLLAALRIARARTRPGSRARSASASLMVRSGSHW